MLASSVCLCLLLSISQSIVVLTEIARLANSSCIKFTIFVLAQLCKLHTALRVVAVLAHATSVVMLINVRAFSDDFSVLNRPLTLIIPRCLCLSASALGFRGWLAIFADLKLYLSRLKIL